MRPLNLSLQAFGPFAKEVRLDFSELGEHRIFAITGPTGAGKSTIFEAIYFALYGRTTAKGRKEIDLKSDFVDDEVLAWVSLDFLVDGKAWQIYREPRQWRKKARGGRTAASQSLIFKSLDDATFVPRTHLEEVNRYIEMLLGLDAEQFKKIIMLPQGEFRSFLSDKTDDKEKVLRSLFETEIYEKIALLAKEDIANLERQAKEARVKIETQAETLEGFGSAYGETLKDKLVFVAAQDAYGFAKSTQNYCKAKAKWQQFKAYQEQEQKRLDAHLRLAQLEVEKASFEKEAVRIAELEALLQQGKLAENIRPYADSLKAMQQEVQTSAAHLLQLKNRTREAQKEVETYTQKLDSLAKEKDTIEQHVHKLTETEKHYQMRLEVDALEPEYQEKKSHFEAEKKLFAKAKEELLQAETQQKSYLLATEEKHALQEELINLRQDVETHRNLLDAWRSYAKIVQEINKLKKEEALQRHIVEDLVEKEKEAKEQLKEAETLQVAALAVSLQEGKPCPVCGSLHHPAPAQSKKASSVDLKDIQIRWQETLKSRSDAETKWIAIKNRLADLQAHYDKYQENLIALGCATLPEGFEDIVEQGKQVSARYGALQEQTTRCQESIDAYAKGILKEPVQTRLSNAKAQYEAHEAQERAAWQHYQECATRRKALVGSEQNLPEASVLKKEIERIKALIENHQKKRTQVEEMYQRVKERYAAEEAAYREAEVQHKKWQEKVCHAEKTWLLERERVFSSNEAYEKAIQALQNTHAYQKDIDAFKEKRQQRMGEMASFKKICGTEPVPSQETLDAVYKKEEHLYQLQVVDFEAQKKRQQSHAARILNIADALLSLDVLEKHYRVVASASKLINGENPWKMRFETFVLVHYFLRVLEQANARMKKMSAGRYTLERRVDVKDKRRATGLDLDIMDVYTSKPRDVASLSGGEGFKASLALALGLADVVAEESASRALDTMFIDEGFGTLDADSLEQTMEVLNNLEQDGRLIGLISHVDALKERLPARLVVEATEQGSRAYFDVENR